MDPKLIAALNALAARMEKGLIGEAEMTALAEKISAAVKAAVPAAPNIDAKTIEQMVAEKMAEKMAEMKRANGGSFTHPEGSQIARLYALETAATVKTSNAELVEFQKRHDRYYALRSIAELVMRKPGLAQSSRVFKEYEEVAKAVYSTNVGKGDEWVYPGFSALVQERVDLSTEVWNLFGDMPIPQGVEDWTFPVLGARGAIYIHGQPTSDDPSKRTASTPGTNKLTISPVTLAGRFVFTDEMSEDSAVAVLDWLISEMTELFARGFDDAVVNGDVSGTHQDADVTNAGDHRKAWKGLRKMAAEIGGTNRVDLGGVPSEDQLLDLRKGLGKMGARASDLTLICSLSGYLRLVKLDSFRTVEKYGPGATVLTGEVGKFYGIPVVISEFLREDMDATGVRAAGASTKTGYLLINRKGFTRSSKRQLGIASQPDILTGVTHLVGTARTGFHRIRTASDEKPVVYGYNVNI